MINEKQGTTIQIMGKEYHVKCQDSEIPALHRAAQLVEEQMIAAREVAKVLSLDRIAVLAALNIAHQFLNLDDQHKITTQTVKQKLLQIQSNVQQALTEHQQLELISAE